MQQLALFREVESEPKTLVDDASGRIFYAPHVIDEALCATWFDDLRTSIDWQHERRPMYDRMVDVPRLTAYFGPGEPLLATLRKAKRVVEALAGARFNSVGLNFYRDGRDSVAMHNDSSGELVTGTPVALLSLGSARRMRLHSKARPRRVFDIPLDPGSVLVMAGAAQEHWEHGIPKTRELVGPRISLAFRQRPA